MSCHPTCPICSTTPARPIPVPALSSALDALIIELDACPAPLRRLRLRLWKRALEVFVPSEVRR